MDIKKAKNIYFQYYCNLAGFLKEYAIKSEDVEKFYKIINEHKYE